MGNIVVGGKKNPDLVQLVKELDADKAEVLGESADEDYHAPAPPPQASPSPVFLGPAAQHFQADEVEDAEDIQELTADGSANCEDDGYFKSPNRDGYGYLESNVPAGGRAKYEAPIVWKRGDTLGSGAFGTVVLGLNVNNGELMAVKQVCIEGLDEVDRLVQALEEEIGLMRGLEHPNIVRYWGTSREGNMVNIFMEYVPGGSIATLLRKFGRLNESVARNYVRQILNGLLYLHRHRIIHRDIKGGNILVDNSGCCKLADFGASKRMSDISSSSHHSLRGTPYWMAPEVIKQTGHGRHADIWSVGCTVIEMTTGKPPWAEFTSQISAMFQIAVAKDPPRFPDSLSADAKDFLLLCFNREPRERPNASQLLEHPFIVKELRTPQFERAGARGASAAAARSRALTSPVRSQLPPHQRASPAHVAVATPTTQTGEEWWECSNDDVSSGTGTWRRTSARPTGHHERAPQGATPAAHLSAAGGGGVVDSFRTQARRAEAARHVLSRAEQAPPQRFPHQPATPSPSGVSAGGAAAHHRPQRALSRGTRRTSGSGREAPRVRAVFPFEKERPVELRCLPRVRLAVKMRLRCPASFACDVRPSALMAPCTLPGGGAVRTPATRAAATAAVAPVAAVAGAVAAVRLASVKPRALIRADSPCTPSNYTMRSKPPTFTYNAPAGAHRSRPRIDSGAFRANHHAAAHWSGWCGRFCEPRYGRPAAASEALPRPRPSICAHSLLVYLFSVHCLVVHPCAALRSLRWILHEAESPRRPGAKRCSALTNVRERASRTGRARSSAASPRSSRSPRSVRTRRSARRSSGTRTR